MVGELNNMQIDHFLLSQYIGRLGCTDGKNPYIIPVTYAFDGYAIIGQTNEGKKLDIVRQNPVICFQVDNVIDMSNWRSVIVAGVFEELEGDAADSARAYLSDHVWPMMTSSTIHLHEHSAATDIPIDTRVKTIMFSIKVDEKSGRFEKQ